MEASIQNYVRICNACHRNKTARHKKYGKLVPLEIPSRPWEPISMDFITDLPNAKGYNQCGVIVDRFTRMAHFIPLWKLKAKDLALAFVRKIWRLHGLPKSVVSNRDTVFMSSFRTEVMRLIVLNRISRQHTIPKLIDKQNQSTRSRALYYNILRLGPERLGRTLTIHKVLLQSYCSQLNKANPIFCCLLSTPWK